MLTLDLPGHGSSANLRATLDETADWLVASLPDEPLALGGYSYGARVALHVALRHPTRLSKLVLLGVTRGIKDGAERAARRERDERLAERIVAIGTEAFLDEWLAQPLFASLPDDELERAARSRDAEGLANSLRLSGTGTQEWLASRLATITVPTLALAGAEDARFSVEAEAIAESVQYGTFDLIDRAGHAAHLEQPRQTARRVARFLDS